MEAPIMRRMALSLSLIALSNAFVTAAHGSDSLALKTSRVLGQYQQTALKQTDVKRVDQGLLAKVALFRGVAVDESTRSTAKSNQTKIELEETENSAVSMVKAVYGGLQISFKENLSLVYAPGRLSGNSLNSESQGLYLLANRGGVANWFVGVESRSYNNTTESRRSANSAQFGVIMNLD